jgi:hypothetical protein
LNHVMEKSHLDKIIPVRLSVNQWETIREEAIRKGIGVSTLTRMWIMEYLGKLDKKSVRKNMAVRSR